MESEEARFDFTVLERALEDRAQTPIHHLVDAGETELDVAVEPQVGEGDVVIDIRHPDEAGLKPLALTADQLLEIPFFRLNGQFGKLDPQRRYLLYCEKGVMSQLHAAHLMDAGHRNIGVYRPE